MRLSPTLAVPNPAAPPPAYVIAAAIEARRELMSRRDLDQFRVPLAAIAQRTAWRWCAEGRFGLRLDGHDLAFLAASIVELLAIDAPTLTFLRQQGIVSPPGFQPPAFRTRWSGGER